MRIWANTLVKNEDRFLWFSVMSVINQVDKILIWDTGSTDATISQIQKIKKLYPDKVDFRQVGNVTAESFTRMRDEMLQKTLADWVILVDGDEVWWDEEIQKVIKLIRTQGNELESIVNIYYNLVGDIYHYQEKSAGMYEIDDQKGHLNIRALNTKIPGLHVANPHPQDAYFDKFGIPIQQRDPKKRIKLSGPNYFHLTHLVRSTLQNNEVPKRSMKLKYEIGNRLPYDFYYPEVFFRPKPIIVPDPWQKMERSYLLRSLIETPFKKIRRIFLDV